MTLLVFAAPMLVLYLFSIGVAWMFGKKTGQVELTDRMRLRMRRSAFRRQRSWSCCRRSPAACSERARVCDAGSRDRAVPDVRRGARRHRERVRRARSRPTQLVYGSIDGMLRTLDPHSSFLDREATTRRCASGRTGTYFGIGISIVSLDGEITVTSLFEGSPAYRAGIRRNDVIARVGKRKERKPGRTRGKRPRAGRPRKSSSASRGRKGTTVEISIRRPGVDTAHRSDGRARRDPDHHRPHGVHDGAGHRLRPPAGLLGDDQRRSSARRSPSSRPPGCSSWCSTCGTTRAVRSIRRLPCRTGS